MQTSAIYIKTDPEIKSKAQKVAKDLGFSLSSLMNAWLRHLIKTKTVTFSVRDEMPNARTRAILKQAEKNLKEGKHSPIFDNAKDAIAWLHEDHEDII